MRDRPVCVRIEEVRDRPVCVRREEVRDRSICVRRDGVRTGQSVSVSYTHLTLPTKVNV